MNLLEYPVTRAIRLRRTWATVLILGAILWITVITLINVAAVGYELVPLTSTSYSSSESLLWYERFMPKSSRMGNYKVDGWLDLDLPN